MEQGLIHDLAAAYALDALDDSERREFEEHLAACERCSGELGELQGAASALAYVAEGPAPPAALRERLLERVREEGPSNVVALRRRRWVLPAAASFATVAAAAAIVLGVWATSLSNDLDRTERAMAVVASADARTVALGNESRLFVRPNGDAALVTSLSHAPKGKTYELWVIRGKTPLSAGLFAEGKSGTAVLLSRRVPKGAQIGLSIERAGGAPSPTQILFVSETV